MCNYRYPRFTLTQLGELYGVTNQQVGKWLAEAGLRDDKGKPTRTAHDGGYCETAPSRNDNYVWAWLPKKVVPVLERKGHTMLRMPPVALVEPPPLSGPFGCRTDASGLTEVINADGTVAALVPGRQQADKLIAVLNAAHKLGYLGVVPPSH